MYDPNQVKAALIGVVGWRQDNGTSGLQLTEMTSSSSGLWFNSKHPLLTLDNLQSVARNYVNDPDLSEVQKNEKFTEWVKERTEEGILQVLNDWLDGHSGLRSSHVCDYTTQIIAQKNVFKTAIALAVARIMLRELAFNANARFNDNEANVDFANTLFEIDGDSQGRKGFSLLGQYEKALSGISFDITDIPQKCLKCKRRMIKNKVIGPSLPPLSPPRSEWSSE